MARPSCGSRPEELFCSFARDQRSQLKFAEPRFLRFANSLLKVADPTAGSPSTLWHRPAASVIANPRPSITNLRRGSLSVIANHFFSSSLFPIDLTLAHHHRTRVRILGCDFETEEARKKMQKNKCRGNPVLFFCIFGVLHSVRTSGFFLSICGECR
jgi:hypothetical protein